jgi:hypothetical protein
MQVKRAIELRNIVTSLGPAYIKLGQVRGAACVRGWRWLRTGSRRHGMFEQC